jgi:flagellar basal body rod protein FlgG
VLRTLQTASQAMHLEQTRIDTLANNLANVSTAGFRQVLTRVSERAAPDAPADAGQELAAAAPDQANGLPANRDSGTDRVMSPAVDPRAGALQSTGRGTDLALSGRGYFVVQDSEGNPFYTRNGAFRLDDTGQLVDAAGNAVQSSGGPINAAGGVLSVDVDGTVSIDGAPRGRLKVVDFARPQDLTHRGDNLMQAGDLEPTDVDPSEITVMQGFLEGSNVDPVQTLVDMIAAQRAFELGSKVMQANDEMLGRSVNTLGRNS